MEPGQIAEWAKNFHHQRQLVVHGDKAKIAPKPTKLECLRKHRENIRKCARDLGIKWNRDGALISNEKIHRSSNEYSHACSASSTTKPQYISQPQTYSPHTSPKYTNQSLNARDRHTRDPCSRPICPPSRPKSPLQSGICAVSEGPSFDTHRSVEDCPQSPLQSGICAVPDFDTHRSVEDCPQSPLVSGIRAGGPSFDAHRSVEDLLAQWRAHHVACQEEVSALPLELPIVSVDDSSDPEAVLHRIKLRLGVHEQVNDACTKTRLPPRNSLDVSVDSEDVLQQWRDLVSSVPQSPMKPSLEIPADGCVTEAVLPTSPAVGSLSSIQLSLESLVSAPTLHTDVSYSPFVRLSESPQLGSGAEIQCKSKMCDPDIPKSHTYSTPQDVILPPVPSSITPVFDMVPKSSTFGAEIQPSSSRSALGDCDQVVPPLLFPDRTERSPRPSYGVSPVRARTPSKISRGQSLTSLFDNVTQFSSQSSNGLLDLVALPPGIAPVPQPYESIRDSILSLSRDSDIDWRPHRYESAVDQTRGRCIAAVVHRKNGECIAAPVLSIDTALSPVSQATHCLHSSPPAQDGAGKKTVEAARINGEVPHGAGKPTVGPAWENLEAAQNRAEIRAVGTPWTNTEVAQNRAEELTVETGWVNSDAAQNGTGIRGVETARINAEMVQHGAETRTVDTPWANTKISHNGAGIRTAWTNAEVAQNTAEELTVETGWANSDAAQNGTAVRGVETAGINAEIAHIGAETRTVDTPWANTEISHNGAGIRTAWANTEISHNGAGIRTVDTPWANTEVGTQTSFDCSDKLREDSSGKTERYPWGHVENILRQLPPLPTPMKRAPDAVLKTYLLFRQQQALLAR